MSLSTHVLDTSRGRPAAGVAIDAARRGGEIVASAVTDADGRARLGDALAAGEYELEFAVGDYFGEPRLPRPRARALPDRRSGRPLPRPAARLPLVLQHVPR